MDKNSLDELLDGLGPDTALAFKKGWDDEIEKLPIEGLKPDELENLVHTLTARRLVDMLRDPIACTPGVLQAALRFLKDNDISALPMSGSASDKLREQLKTVLPFQPRLTGTD
jgi:hypothetical protein